MPRRQTDDEPRVRRRESSGGSGKKLALILGGLGLGVFLICTGACGFWLYTLSKLDPAEGARVRQLELEQRWKQQEKAATSDLFRAKAFCDYWQLEVQRGNFDEAYRRMSSAYQAQFERFMLTHADLKTENPGWSFGLDGKPRDKYVFLLSRPGPPPYGLVVIRERDEWRMDDIEVK